MMANVNNKKGGPKTTQPNNKGKTRPKKAGGGNKPANKAIALRAPTRQMAVTQIRQREQAKAQAKKRNLPKDSVNFFTSAIDPMHDTTISLAGWPDRNIELSVIRKMPQSVELAMPDGTANPNFATTENWDCHINLQPFLNALQFHESDRVNNNSYVTSGDTTVIGGLMAYATNHGVDFTYGTENGPTGTVPRIGALEIDEEISVGVGRIIGLGIEVINMTAPLYKSGLCYLWRAPEPNNDPETWYQTASSGTTPNIVYLQNAFSAQILRHPPRNIAEAQLYTGTASWEAQEGGYMVATFHDFENPARMVSYEQPIIINAQDIEDHTYTALGGGTPNETKVWIPDAIAGVDTPTQFGLPANRIYPLNQMGMIFVGLTKQSALTLRMTYYYESFPSLAQTAILTLARPSTRYDSLVLDLLAKTMRTLPVAVKCKENAEGDWWDRVLQAVQLVAPGIMAMIPGGEMFSPGAFAAVTALRKFRNE